VLQVGLGQAAVAGLVQVAAADGLRDGALDPGPVRVAVPPGRGGLLGAELTLGLVLRAGAEGEMAGLVGAWVQRARSGQGVQSEVRKVTWTMGSPWRLVLPRRLRAVLWLGQVTCWWSQSMPNLVRSKPSWSRACQPGSGGSGPTSSTPWSARAASTPPTLT
jgi:hypothetical protein